MDLDALAARQRARIAGRLQGLDRVEPALLPTVPEPGGFGPGRDAAAEPGPEPPGHTDRRPLPASLGDGRHEIDPGQLLSALQEASSEVEGVSLGDGQVTILSRHVPAADERRRIHALLDDATRLARFRRRAGLPPGDPARPVAPDDDLLTVLLDQGTDDRAWLTAFRRYAATHLLPAPESGADPVAPAERRRGETGPDGEGPDGEGPGDDGPGEISDETGSR